MSIDKNLLLKIEKLLSLATSPNEHEARAAAEKANELLIRHNLSVSDLQVGDDLSAKYSSKPVYEGRIMQFEARWVMNIINNHFFVQTLQQEAKHVPFIKAYNQPAKIWFIGTKTNVEVASYIFQFLCQKYKQCWKQYQKDTGAHNHLKGAYYEGMTDGLHAQLTVKRKQVEQSMALVVKKDPNLEKAMELYHGETKKVGGPRPMEASDLVADDGYREGKNLKIHRGISQSGGKSELALEHKKGS